MSPFLKLVNKLFVCLLLVCTSHQLLAQNNNESAETDTTATQTEEKEVKLQYAKLKDPSKAALLSAALPGLGQFYNKKHWYIRIPIIYSGFALLGYLTFETHQRYILGRDHLVYATLGRPELYYGQYEGARNLTADSFRRIRDRFRRDRDYNIILMLVWYGANIAEAAVTAHLKTFNVDNDLTFELQPYTEQFWGNRATGLTIVAKF